MARDYSAYSRLLTRLLPPGRALRGDDAVRDEAMNGFGVELARVDARVDDLLAEADSRETTELIGEHEADWGLTPASGGFSTGFSQGFAKPTTLAARRLAVLAKLRAVGSLHKSHYIAVAAALGYTITIDEYAPFWSGLGVAGDPCGDQTNLFYWRVNVQTSPAAPVSNYADLVAMLNPLRPAHTVILWSLAGPGFTSGFSRGFNALPAGTSTGGFTNGFSSGFNRQP